MVSDFAAEDAGGVAVYADATATFTGSTFSGNTARQSGGGVYFTGSTGSIDKSAFIGNDVNFGALNLWINAAVTMSDTLFSGNTARQSGGAWSINDNSVLEVSGSTVVGNTASRWGGGAYLVGQSTLEVTDTSFSQNRAGNYGGAIYIDSSATIENSAFSNNFSVYGGAFYVNSSGVLEGSGLFLSGNTTSWYGGALSNAGTVSIDGATFSGNAARYYGGAVYSTSRATIRNAVFATETDTIYFRGSLTLGGKIRTAANITSGNIAVMVEENTQLVLDLSVYEGTTSKELLSGFQTMFGNSQGNLTLSVNVAANQEDGDYILATDVGTLSQQSFTVTLDDDASKSFHISVGDTTLYSSKDYTLSLDGGTLSLVVETLPCITAVVTADGTADTVVIGGVTYTGTAKKTEDIADVTGSTFSLIAMQGGRVQNLEDSPVNLDNEQELIADSVIFYSNNNADGDGGALNNSGKLTVTTFSGLAHGVRTSFSENYSGYNGGAVNNNGVFSATDVLFDGNRADFNGGALYNSSGSATITGATFTGNSAASGGAVYNLNADLTVSDSVFSGNTSSGFGGALLSNNTSQSLTLENCSFLTRTDTVFANGGTITLGGVIVTAAELNFGGAITIKPDTEIILDLSCYSGTELTSGLLANYDASFAPQQDNLTISVNAASLTQKQGNYVIASRVGTLGFKESISVYATGSDESLFSVALGGTTLYNGRSYSLANSGNNIVFSIAGNIDTLYVNSEWAGLADGTQVVIPGGITAHIGVDAFDSFTYAKALYPEKIKFAGGSYGDVIFGGSESENVEDVEANTNLTFLNGTFSKSVFAGNKIKTQEMLQTLSLESSLDIRAGSYSAYVMGGDYLSTTQSSAAFIYTEGSRTLNISGGTFDGLVAGGFFIAGGTTTLVSQFEGDIDVTISGGTFNKRIYGGDITDKLENSHADFIDGTITVTLDASQNSIDINESIVCGSYGYGTIKGDVVFTVKGTADNLTFADDSVVNGGSGSGYLKTSNGKLVKEYDNFVNGTSTAVFEGFSGDFDARLTLFDAISFDNDADVKLTNAKCNLAELSAWSFADGASVAFCYGQVNDFTGDTLDIDLTGWETADEWTLATGSSDAAFSGFEAFKAVKFDGTAAKYEAGVWKAGEFALSLSEDKKSMVLAQVC